MTSAMPAMNPRQATVNELRRQLHPRLWKLMQHHDVSYAAMLTLIALYQACLAVADNESLTDNGPLNERACMKVVSSPASAARMEVIANVVAELRQILPPPTKCELLQILTEFQQELIRYMLDLERKPRRRLRMRGPGAPQ